MAYSFICNRCNEYYRVAEVGPDCPKCDKNRASDPKFQVNVFREADVELGDKLIHIGSRRDRKAAERIHGIAPIEEIKYRAIEGRNKNQKQYNLSESQKRLNYRLKQDGISTTMYDKHPAFKPYHRKGAK